MSGKVYDIVLFGVTGFTGKLAVEYMLQKKYPVSWAACARSEGKAKKILEEIAQSSETPPLVIADLVCNTPDEEEKLRGIVRSTRVVLSTAGPFEKYGITLHKLCAEEGVHYADITGETSFVRQMIQKHDSLARKKNAALVSHCGNDCIPHDLTVYEMHRFAESKGCRLREIVTYDEFPSEASFSGGTLTTAMYQLSKPKANATDFDPLLTFSNGSKSNFATKITHKSAAFVPEFQRKAGPWIMAPVMANCVRRSNALLGYAPELKFGDAKLDDPSWINYCKAKLYEGVLGAALLVPPIQRFLPQPGQGPDRATMETGYLKLHGRGVMVNDAGDEETVATLFHFKADTAYLMTAQMLVETGVLLVEKDKNGSISGGVLTPAVAFGSELTGRITEKMDVTFEFLKQSSAGQ